MVLHISDVQKRVPTDEQDAIQARIVEACADKDGGVVLGALNVFLAAAEYGGRAVVEELLDAGVVGDEWPILWAGCSQNMLTFITILRMNQAREVLEMLPDYWAMVREGQ